MFFFSSRRRHTRWPRDWSSDVCSSDLTMGLVQLPGMMSGQIIAGADPLQAVQFQLLILFLLLTTASVTSVLLGFLSYPTLFNEQMQFTTHLDPEQSELS